MSSDMATALMPTSGGDTPAGGAAPATGLPSWANGLGLAAGAISSIGSVMAGNRQAQASTYNAQVATQQADIVQSEAAAESAQVAQSSKRQIGAAITAAGASGVDPNQGSPINVVADLSAQGDLSRRLVLYRGAMQSQGLRQQATLDLYNADQQRSAGITTGGSNFLSSYLKYLQNSPKTSTSS